MVQITGEIGEPPERVLDIWGARRAARHRASTSDALVHRRADDLHRDPPARRSSPSSCRRSPRRPRRSARRRSRTAARIGGNVVNASPAGDTLPVLLALRRGDRPRQLPPASEPCPPTTSGPPTGRPRVATTSCCVRVRIPLRARPPGAVPQGRHAAGAGDQQGRHGAGLARASDGDPWTRRAPRPRLGGGHHGPRAGDRGGARGRATDARDGRCGRRGARRRDRSRSTTSARPPTTGAPSPAASCIGSSATPEAGEERDVSGPASHPRAGHGLPERGRIPGLARREPRQPRRSSSSATTARDPGRRR